VNRAPGTALLGLVTLLSGSLLSPCKTPEGPWDVVLWDRGQIDCLRWRPDAPHRMQVSFAARSSGFQIDVGDPRFADVVEALAESMQRAVDVEYEWDVHPYDRLTLVELTSTPWQSLPSMLRPFGAAPRSHQMTDVYEGGLQSVGIHGVLWATPLDDPDPDKLFYLRWDAPEARTSFDVLIDAMWKRLPVRVTYYTADGEVIKVERR